MFSVLIHTPKKVACRQGGLKLGEISAMVDSLTNHAFGHDAYEHGYRNMVLRGGVSYYLPPFCSESSDDRKKWTLGS